MPFFMHIKKWLKSAVLSKIMSSCIHTEKKTEYTSAKDTEQYDV